MFFLLLSWLQSPDATDSASNSSDGSNDDSTDNSSDDFNDNSSDTSSDDSGENKSSDADVPYSDILDNDDTDNTTCELKCAARYLANSESCYDKIADCLAECEGADDEDCVAACRTDDNINSCFRHWGNCNIACPCWQQNLLCDKACVDEGLTQQCLDECLVGRFDCAGYRSPHFCSMRCLNFHELEYCEDLHKDDETMDGYLACNALVNQAESFCFEDCLAFPSFEVHHSGDCQTDCVANFSDGLVLAAQQTEKCLARCQSMDDQICLDSCMNVAVWERNYYSNCVNRCPCYFDKIYCFLDCQNDQDCINDCDESMPGCDNTLASCQWQCDRDNTDCLYKCKNDNPEDIDAYRSCYQLCASDVSECLDNCAN